MSEATKEPDSSEGSDDSESPSPGNIVAATLQNFDYIQVLSRLKEMLFSPKATWATIQNENASLRQLYMSYFIPMNILASLCIYIGKVVHTNAVVGPLVGTFVQFAVALGVLWVAAKLMEVLAPKFQGTSRFDDGARLFCFSLFPAMAAQLFQLVQGPVAQLILLSGGLYSLYIFVTGVPHMIQIPASRKVGFVISVILILGILLATCSLILSKIFPYVG